MRKIYTLLLSLVASVAAWAQSSPDPSTWNVGDNVIADLGMGDYDPTQVWSCKAKESASSKTPGDFGTYWKGKGQLLFSDYQDATGSLHSGNADLMQTGIGFYGDGSIAKEADPVNIYQIVKLPAGWYTIRVQSCFRDVGGQAGAPYGSWKKYKEDWTPYPKMAWAYVDVYASQADAEDDAKKPVQVFEKDVRHIGDSEQEDERLATSLDESWRDDETYTINTTEYDEFFGENVDVSYTFAYPRSMVGATYYFKAGKYWNEFDVLLEKEAYVRIGIRKLYNNAEDWLTMSEWQVIYNGNPEEDEEVSADYAQTQLDKEVEGINTMKEKLQTKDFEGIHNDFNNSVAAYLEDIIMEAQSEFGDATTADERQAIIDQMKALNLQNDADYESFGNLSFLLEKSKSLLAMTNYPGKTTFQTAYDKIYKNVRKASFDETNLPGEFVQKCYDELVDARGAYLDTQEKDENGAKDFSAVINFPWFVQDKYAPTKKEDGTWSLDEETWLDAVGSGSDTYANKKGERTDIAKGVEIIDNSTTVKNKWFEDKDMDGKNNAITLEYIDNGLMAVHDGWHAANFNSGSMKVCQNVLGLPKGYYSLKALIRKSGGGTGNYHNIFMQSVSGEVKSSPVVASQEDNVWQEVSTGIILVKEGDRELLIGGQSDQLALYTGFRLLFYGTDPPIENLIKEEIAEIQESATALTFEGDKKYVNEQIAKCDLSALNLETFETYRGYVDDARQYITAALKEYQNQKAADTYAQILTDNGSVDGVAEIIEKPMGAADELGKAEADTYKDIDGVNKLAEKYGEYIKVYAEAADFAKNDAGLKTTLDEQKAYLSSNVATTSRLDSYMSHLATPININKMEDLNAANATAAAPADLTSMLLNPSFDKRLVDGAWVENDCEWQRGYADGWHGMDINTYDQTMQLSRNCCELWNSGTGEFYQEIVGMPAGKYRISCLAVYRDEDITEESVATFEAAGNEKNWEGHNNAQIYAKTQSDEAFSYIKAQAGLKGTDNSFNDVVRGYEVMDEEADPKEYYATMVTVLAPEGEGHDDVKYPYVTDQDGWTNVDPNAEDRAPFDKIINGAYYPNSLYGIKQWFLNSPAKVTNTVEIEVKSGETLRLGLRKPTSASNDCLTFDDFKIEYLSGDTFKDILTGIEDVTIEKPVQNVLYNTAGQIVDSSYKGIVIDSNGKKYIQ
ncbi:MAG: hypothetical protein J6T38_00730 [Bacteroidaceae bacterium]|nr:hypothetical protein [Bacteroidaceae bacterium]